MRYIFCLFLLFESCSSMTLACDNFQGEYYLINIFSNNKQYVGDESYAYCIVSKSALQNAALNITNVDVKGRGLMFVLTMFKGYYVPDDILKEMTYCCKKYNDAFIHYFDLDSNEQQYIDSLDWFDSQVKSLMNTNNMVLKYDLYETDYKLNIVKINVSFHVCKADPFYYRQAVSNKVIALFEDVHTAGRFKRREKKQLKKLFETICNKLQ